MCRKMYMHFKRHYIEDILSPTKSNKRKIKMFIISVGFKIFCRDKNLKNKIKKLKEKKELL